MGKILHLLYPSLMVLCACDGQVSQFYGGREEAERAAELELSKAKDWVTDAAHIIDNGSEGRIRQQLQQLERKTGHQMVVVTVPTLEGRGIEEYSIDLARRWGIGRRDHNDGVVVLVAPNEREVRIEVGSGLEQVVTNSFAATVIQNDMLPRFKERDYNKGISAGVATVTARLSTP